MPKELEELKEVRGVEGVYVHGSYARGHLKGDMSQWDGEIDTIVFTKGKEYETLEAAHDYIASLDPDIYEISIHNIEELKGVITDIFEPDMASRLSTTCLPIYGKDLRPLLQKNKDLWKEAREKTGIETNYFSKISDRLRHLRIGRTQLTKKVSNNMKVDNREFKRENNRALSLMRVGLTMKEIDLGENDDGSNVIKEFLEAYPRMKRHKSTMEKLVEENKNFLSLSQEDAWKLTRQWVRTGEAAAYVLDKHVCDLIGI